MASHQPNPTKFNWVQQHSLELEETWRRPKGPANRPGMKSRQGSPQTKYSIGSYLFQLLHATLHKRETSNSERKAMDSHTTRRTCFVSESPRPRAPQKSLVLYKREMIAPKDPK
jgi:hypothetical protein